MRVFLKGCEKHEFKSMGLGLGMVVQAHVPEIQVYLLLIQHSANVHLGDNR